MKIYRNSIFAALASMCVLSGCSEGAIDGDDPKDPINIIIGGYTQKGPFITGSDVAVQELDGALNPTGKSFQTQISNDQGNFNIECLTANEYAEFVAEGYYFNETIGDLSSSKLTLRALSKIDKATNINVLTTLQCNRIKSLIRGGASFESAAEQSKKEVLELFGLKDYPVSNFDDMDISKSGESNSILLAISSILQQDRSVGEMSELIAKLANDLADDGVVGAEALKEKLTNSARKVKPTEVVNNLQSRYAELGVEVEIVDFSQFVDFDGDGVVGNDVLSDGEQVILSETVLNVPCEGGNYTITMESPIKLFLEKLVSDGELSYDIYYSDLYDQILELQYDATLNDNSIEITVRKMESRGDASKTIYLYDCRGNEVATIVINQEGDINAPLPKLGETGSAAVMGMASYMAKAFQQFNLAEQYYGANAEFPCVNDQIYPNSSIVKECWQGYYSTINRVLQLKDVDAKLLSVYQEVLDVFGAMCYYHMVVAWGDVPYIPNYEWYNGGDYALARTDATEIFEKLKIELSDAINTLDEKRNSSMDNVNDLFFVSKDVASILLADIYMYLGEYAEAKELLKSVIDNGYYELDNYNYSEQSFIDNINNGQEVIFAVLNNQNTRSVVIATPSVLPIFTYSDVVLSYAECLYHTNDTANAKIYSDKVLTAKGLSSCGDTFEDIKLMRKTLYNYSVGNFAFFKRNGIAEDVYDIDKYQLLFPIPQSELVLNPNMTQNTGY